MRGIYIQKFNKISVKISPWGVRTLIVAPVGVKFGTEEWTDPSSCSATIHGPTIEGLLSPPFGEALGPHLTVSRGLSPYQVAS